MAAGCDWRCHYPKRAMAASEERFFAALGTAFSVPVRQITPHDDSRKRVSATSRPKRVFFLGGGNILYFLRGREGDLKWPPSAVKRGCRGKASHLNSEWKTRACYW